LGSLPFSAIRLFVRCCCFYVPITYVGSRCCTITISNATDLPLPVTFYHYTPDYLWDTISCLLFSLCVSRCLITIRHSPRVMTVSRYRLPVPPPAHSTVDGLCLHYHIVHVFLIPLLVIRFDTVPVVTAPMFILPVPYVDLSTYLPVDTHTTDTTCHSVWDTCRFYISHLPSTVEYRLQLYRLHYRHS